MQVPEKRQASPCRHCAGDHPDESCMWREEDWEHHCPHCYELLSYDYEGIGWCRDHGCVTEGG